MLLVRCQILNLSVPTIDLYTCDRHQNDSFIKIPRGKYFVKNITNNYEIL